MDNFINKNKIKETWDYQKVHELSCPLPYPKQPLQEILNEDNATELLLMISEQDTQKMKINNENIRSEVDLTPWANVNIKLNCQKKQSSSKKSLILPFCGNANRIPQSNKQNTQITQDSDNRVIFISTEHKKCRKRKKKFRYQFAEGVEDKQNIVSKCEIVIVKRKNSQKQSKNSHSTFARYSDHASQWSSTISTHNPNSLCKYDPKKYRSDFQNKTQAQNINYKSISGMIIQAKRYSKTNRQNQPMELYGRLVPKLENINPRSSTTNTNNTKFIKCMNSNGSSATNPILRKNTSVLNELHNRGINQFHQYMDFVRMERKKKAEDLEQRKQGNSFMKNEILSDYHTPVEKHEQQQKYPNQYQKIKRQIVSNIQKESIIKISLPTNEKNSKKILGKYLKQNLIKRQRDLTKPQILDEAYPSNNPITKHLYDRYKKLLSKNK